MPVVVAVALVGAGSAAFGAMLVFLAKWRFEAPVEGRKAEAAMEAAGTAAGTLLLGQVTYLNGLINPLQEQVRLLSDKLAANTKACDERIASIAATKDREIEALQIQAAKLLIRVGEIDGKGSAPHAQP